jgi:hypothetical protein
VWAAREDDKPPPASLLRPLVALQTNAYGKSPAPTKGPLLEISKRRQG